MVKKEDAVYDPHFMHANKITHTDGGETCANKSNRIIPGSVFRYVSVVPNQDNMFHFFEILKVENITYVISLSQCEEGEVICAE